MGIAALVLGIVSAVFGCIPLCGTWTIIPAIVGLILGFVDCAKKKKEEAPKGKAIAGIVCSIAAIVIIIAWWIMAGVAVKSGVKTLESTDWNEVFTDWNVTIDE